jgi:hypothetical protein
MTIGTSKVGETEIARSVIDSANRNGMNQAEIARLIAHCDSISKQGLMIGPGDEKLCVPESLRWASNILHASNLSNVSLDGPNTAQVLSEIHRMTIKLETAKQLGKVTELWVWNREKSSRVIQVCSVTSFHRHRVLLETGILEPNFLGMLYDNQHSERESTHGLNAIYAYKPSGMNKEPKVRLNLIGECSLDGIINLVNDDVGESRMMEVSRSSVLGSVATVRVHEESFSLRCHIREMIHDQGYQLGKWRLDNPAYSTFTPRINISLRSDFDDSYRFMLCDTSGIFRCEGKDSQAEDKMYFESLFNGNISITTTYSLPTDDAENQLIWDSLRALCDEEIDPIIREIIRISIPYNSKVRFKNKNMYDITNNSMIEHTEVTYHGAVEVRRTEPHLREAGRAQLPSSGYVKDVMSRYVKSTNHYRKERRAWVKARRRRSKERENLRTMYCLSSAIARV